VEAAKVYAGTPEALHLRAMNIIYETTKERGTTILMPTSMVDSMNVALPLAVANQRLPEGDCLRVAGLIGRPAALRISVQF
jgi:hypothetical protein